MRAIIRSLAILIIGLQTGCSSHSQQDARLTRLDSLFNAAHKADKFNGNVLIAENGKIIYQESFGKADWKTDRALNDASVFELASVSKQFTAMGILLLAEKGKLSLDDSLRKFFPQLPYSDVTVRQLLHHTSGLPDYMDLFQKHWDPKKIAGNDDIIALMAEHKPALLFTPGSKWEYSNTGYALLASIIAKVSGKSFAEYLKENIFDPLGMKNTTVYSRRLEKRKIDNYAYGHVYDPAGKTYKLPDDMPAYASMVYSLDGIHGDGCVNSTTGDLFTWHQALSQDKLLPAARMKEVFTPGKSSNGPTGYGYGWAINESKTYGRLANHSGGWPGYSTYIERHLDNDKLIVILQNNGKPLIPAIRVRSILYNIPEEKLVEQPVSAEEMKAYAGVYELTTDFRITVFAKDDKLFVQATGQQALEIFRDKDDLFFLKAVEAKIRFNRSQDGKLESLTLIQNGLEQTGRKIE